jgi:hypothetical protein
MREMQKMIEKHTQEKKALELEFSERLNAEK